jgi:hypothetical protein
MDLDDIKNRMKRVYLSINQRYDDDLVKHINIKHTQTAKGGEVSISFGGDDQTEAINQTFLIISNLAKLKDHLKKLLVSKGGSGSDIENEIDQSEHLKLVVDLDNTEKHGKGRDSRSGKHPSLSNIGRALSSKSGQSMSFTIDPFSGAFQTEGDVAIVITADILDNNGNKICSLEELVNKSIETWEHIIQKYNLI